MVTVSNSLGEEIAYNTISPWTFLQTIKASIMTKNNVLISVLLGEQFKMYIMVPQRSKETTKTPEGIPVSLLVAIQETQDNMKDRGSRDSTVELNDTVIHQLQIQCHH